MMTEKQEKELLEIQCRKQAESRKVRSTAAFYDADYWGEYWGARFNSFPDENDPVTKNETLKKVEFIKRYFTRCQSILDCACSFGFIPAAFQDIGWRAAGVDISKAAIEHAPERVRDKIYPVSITDMNMFADSSFDLVCAFDVLEHLYIEEIMPAVSEISRVAKYSILLRLPVPSFGAEPGQADLSHEGLTREHVSMYDTMWWARRFHERNKFRFWFSQIWNNSEELHAPVAEGWIAFGLTRNG